MGTRNVAIIGGSLVVAITLIGGANFVLSQPQGNLQPTATADCVTDVTLCPLAHTTASSTPIVAAAGAIRQIVTLGNPSTAQSSSQTQADTKPATSTIATQPPYVGPFPGTPNTGLDQTSASTTASTYSSSSTSSQVSTSSTVQSSTSTRYTAPQMQSSSTSTIPDQSEPAGSFKDFIRFMLFPSNRD